MTKEHSKRARTALMALLIAAAAHGSDGREALQEEGWELTGTVYGFLPSVTGEARLPTGAIQDIEVGAGDLIDHLEFAAMGSLELRRARWGVFTDLIYLDLEGSRAATRELEVVGLPLPPGVTAHASLELRGSAWTLASGYRLIDGADTQIELFAGARRLSLEGTLRWELSADFGPFAGPARRGRGSATEKIWGGLVGTRGRHHFGAESVWYVAYYADVGTGASELTWQAAATLGRSIGRMDVFAGWRHLAFDFEPSQPLRRMAFSGPALGIARRW